MLREACGGNFQDLNRRCICEQILLIGVEKFGVCECTPMLRGAIAIVKHLSDTEEVSAENVSRVFIGEHADEFAQKRFESFLGFGLREHLAGGFEPRVKRVWVEAQQKDLFPLCCSKNVELSSALAQVALVVMLELVVFQPHPVVFEFPEVVRAVRSFLHSLVPEVVGRKPTFPDAGVEECLKVTFLPGFRKPTAVLPSITIRTDEIAFPHPLQSAARAQMRAAVFGTELAQHRWRACANLAPPLTVRRALAARDALLRALQAMVPPLPVRRAKQ